MTHSLISPEPELPTTPPKAAPQVKLTLPTPPSFSTRRAQGHARSQSGITESPDSPARLTQASATKKKGHNRSVSFNEEIEIKKLSPDGGKYMIPQRKLSMTAPDEEKQEILTDLVSPINRRGPPSALLLGSRPSPTGSLRSPFKGGPKSAPILALSQRGQSRFSTTAAARGISIAPTLAKMKENREKKQTGLIGNSIWSAGVTACGGWITPGLSSAKSVMSASGVARQRGISVAVIKDGKEMLVESGPITPGLPSARKTGESLKTPGPLSAKSPGAPKEVILCRYHHTPGLTCTSRPCRFVHDLSAIPLSPSVDPSKLRMLSPTDATKGTFARAQAEVLSPTRSFIVKEGEKGVEVEVGEAQPGEVVVLHGAAGDMEGTVYYMSGGGKGPAGKSKTKFKTVKCRDYVEGFCPYGEHCSFIHEEDKPVEPKASASAKDRSTAPETTPVIDEVKLTPDTKDEAKKEETQATKPKKARPVPIQSAWRKGPPKFVKPDGLSAFAPPYSAQPVLVDHQGEIKPVELVQSPVPIAITPASAWEKGSPVPLLVKTDTETTQTEEIMQEVEIEPPTPSFAHLMPPISAWTNYSNDSDPAGPWDPARQKSLEYPTHQQYYHGYMGTPSFPEGAVYPWGIPMTSIPMGMGYTTMEPQFPGGPGVLWTPNGWAVQDAAMKKVLGRVEKSSSGGKGKPGGVKGYYRKRPCRFFAQGKCPHGDNCTYLHVLPTAHDSSSDSDDPPKPAKPPTLPCKFYNSQSGCFNGPSCSFLHTLVIPTGVQPVTRPRPWRTRPCRHFQLGKCNLGDTCHFAHCVDPNFVYPEGYEATRNTTGQFCEVFMKNGRCAEGSGYKHVHYCPEGVCGDYKVEDHEEMAARVEELIKMVKTSKTVEDSDEDEDDDVEIVTADTSFTALVSPV